MTDALLASARHLLQHHPFVGASAEALALVLQECTERTYRDDEVICRERTYGDEMWVLVAGRVKVLRKDIRGADHLIATVDAPDLIGPLSLIDNAIRSATVLADGPVLTRVLDRGTYIRLSNAATPAGAALRGLLLSSLHRQLSRTHARVRSVVQGATAPPTGPLRPAPTVVIVEEPAPPGPLSSLTEADLVQIDLTEEETLGALDALTTNG